MILCISEKSYRRRRLYTATSFLAMGLAALLLSYGSDNSKDGFIWTFACVFFISIGIIYMAGGRWVRTVIDGGGVDEKLFYSLPSLLEIWSDKMAVNFMDIANYSGKEIRYFKGGKKHSHLLAAIKMSVAMVDEPDSSNLIWFIAYYCPIGKGMASTKPQWVPLNQVVDAGSHDLSQVVQVMCEKMDAGMLAEGDKLGAYYYPKPINCKPFSDWIIRVNVS